MANYNTDIIIDAEVGSFQEKYMEYAHNWEDDTSKEKKRVKIIYAPNKDEKISFEDKINSYIEKNANSIKIYDIKYNESSILIIYENLNFN